MIHSAVNWYRSLYARWTTSWNRVRARLSIDGLSRDLKVSPTPIREAPARLESDGLVTKRPHHGYTAIPLIDARAFDELFRTRLLLEPACAAWVCTVGITDDALREHERVLTAVTHRDEAGAAQAMSAHPSASRVRLAGALNATGDA